MASAIPGATTALLALATSALPEGTTIWFGETPPAYQSAVSLQIVRVTGDQQPAELGPEYRREEAFSFYCNVVAYAGGPPDFPARMAEAFGAFTPLSEAIANNWTLNGSVRYAEVGNFDIMPETDGNGQSAVVLAFDVRCSQRVTSLN